MFHPYASSLGTIRIHSHGHGRNLKSDGPGAGPGVSESVSPCPSLAPLGVRRHLEGWDVLVLSSSNSALAASGCGCPGT